MERGPFMRSSRKWRVVQPGNRGQIPEVDLVTIQTLSQDFLHEPEQVQFRPCMTFCQMIWPEKGSEMAPNSVKTAEKPPLAGF
jgi:hypothetical protein